MWQAIDVLKLKGVAITNEEAEAVYIGILMHDIGHGPYSHTLETVLIKGVNHEFLSNCFMKQLNEEFNGKLSLAIEIFNDRYHKKFLHQLISSQLDVDRLDYLKRDSFYTGVYEGVIASDRLLNVLNVKDDELVIEEKGIYSVEKFLISRRLMYWQVYLHKTVLSAEYLLINILKRAKELAVKGVCISSSKPLQYFLKNTVDKTTFEQNSEALHQFSLLDDFDLFSAVKMWVNEDDKVLSTLSEMLVNRNLYKIEISNAEFSSEKVNMLKIKAANELNISFEEAAYFVFAETAFNSAYNANDNSINILYKDDTTKDIAIASDQMNINVLSNPVVKYFLCYPKNIQL
jgi:HD superfamily phosphohydrolase